MGVRLILVEKVLGATADVDGVLAGFRQIDCFWRWMNFAGWIAIKE